MNSKFVLCLKNQDCEDLELRKIYQILPDSTASEEGYVRVIDESGEDYLYPGSYFVEIAVPSSAESVFAVATYLTNNANSWEMKDWRFLATSSQNPIDFFHKVHTTVKLTAKSELHPKQGHVLEGTS